MALEQKHAPVELSDALQSGFEDAMGRVKKLNLDPCATLVDQIGGEVWNSWDASQEMPNVVDPDGLTGAEEFDDELVAA